MHSYRISKFDPSATLSQRSHDWTSFSDVGRRRSGELLTLQAYEAVEARYLQAVRLVLIEAKVELLRVTDVLRSSEASTKSSWIREGLTVDIEGAISVCRAQLREELSCHLEADNGFSIDFGFDFYMYVTSPVPLEHVLGEIGKLDLYVEAGLSSPYFSE